MHASSFRNSQRGYTLMEILVAVAIFATIMIVALLIYDQSNRVFKQSNESAEMQQNTRVAFEKVAADLRMAGFDYKRAGTPAGGAPSPWAANRDYSNGAIVTPKVPNGHVYRAIKAGKSGPEPGPTFPTTPGAKVTDNEVEWQEYGSGVFEQPDEQIEYVHEAAITIRANFDYEDPTSFEQGREQQLEEDSKGRFPVITTGNDEIVTYALVSRSGNASANKGSIVFYADVTNGTKAYRDSYPGGSAEDKIEITGVDLTNQYPPYTLMRYTLGPDGKPVGTALADNIRSMTFAYWEDASAKIPLRDITNTKITDFSTLGGLGQYNPANAGTLITERLIRGKVRAVTATIVGMSPQPDRDYTQPAETLAAARNYRQYSLQSTIVGRNLGLRGMPQSNTNPPPAPIMGASCTGWCGVVLLSWSPGPGTGDVTYTILYDTTSTGSFTNVLPAGTQTSYAVDLTQFDISKTYYFRVAATNAAGTTVSSGPPLAVDVRNATKPSAPTAVTATGLPNAIQVSFKPPENFAGGALTCPGTKGYPVEIRGYRILRSETAGFDVNDPTKYVVVANETSTGITADGTGALTFTDTKVANCELYYYRVATVEWCHAKAEYNSTGEVANSISDYSAEANAKSTSTSPPKAPTNFKQSVDSVCDDTMNSCSPVKLSWDKVVKDVAGNDILVKRYSIYRQQKIGATYNEPSPQYVGSITDGSTTFTDSSPLQAFNTSTLARYSYEYTLYAEQACPSPADKSAAAVLVYPDNCVTGATVVPDAEGPGSGTPDDPMQNVNSLTLVPHLTKPAKGVDVAIDSPPYQALTYPYEVAWDIADGEVHRVSFRVQTADCTEIINYFVEANTPDCAVRAAASNVLGTPNQVQLVLTNVTAEDLTISNFAITWAGQNGYTWDTIRYPSGAPAVATIQGSETTGSPRTVVFNPTGTDRTIKANSTYKVLLNFTGLTAAVPSTITAFSIDYKQGKATTQFGCAPRVVSCSVVATPKVNANGEVIDVEIKNNSEETLTITQFTISWAGQDDWKWSSVTAGSTVDIDPDAAGATTKSFKTTGFQIGPNGTGTIAMNMVPTKKNPAALSAAAVGNVVIEYTTENSGTLTALTCRAK